MSFDNLTSLLLLSAIANGTRALETMYIVSGTVTLVGYTRTAFDANALAAVANATAEVARVAASTVTVVISAAGRRRLVQADVTVEFFVRVASLSCVTAVASNIRNTVPSVYVAVLQRAGSTSCSAVTVSALSITAPELLLTPETVTAESGQDAAQLIKTFNASAATAIQSELLIGLSKANAASLCSAVGDAQVTLSATQAEYTAAFVLATINATAGSSAAVSLPEDALLAALDVLLLVATSTGAIANSSFAVAQSVTSALSAVTFVALSSHSAVVLQQVQLVLMALMNSTAAGLVAQLNALPPGSELPAVNVSSPLVSWVVRVDPPDSLRLTSEPLTVGEAKFLPFPAGLLPPNTTIIASLFELPFNADGYASPTDVIAAGVTTIFRIVLSRVDESIVEISNVTTPIRFNLPAVNTSGNTQAVCAFWDPGVAAFSTRGCAGVPSPRPPEHNVAFIPGFTAANDAVLALAWSISGPMLCGGRCSMTVLDCNDAEPGVVYPDPRNPLAVAAIACPPRVNGSTATQPVLRVYTGSQCELWQTENGYNCRRVLYYAAQCAARLQGRLSTRALTRLLTRHLAVQLGRHQASVCGRWMCCHPRPDTVHVPPPDRLCVGARA